MLEVLNTQQIFVYYMYKFMDFESPTVTNLKSQQLQSRNKFIVQQYITHYFKNSYNIRTFKQ
jgi:hypothetical protein